MTAAPAWNARVAMDVWRAAYLTAYGTEYTPGNWAREMSLAKTLCGRYDHQLFTAIVDVVMRLYPRKWYSDRFPRPTIGAMVSWLAVQAEPYASANLAGGEQTELALDDTPSVDDMVERGWI